MVADIKLGMAVPCWSREVSGVVCCQNGLMCPGDAYQHHDPSPSHDQPPVDSRTTMATCRGGGEQGGR